MVMSSESLSCDAWVRLDPSHRGEFVSDSMEDRDGNRIAVAAATRKLGISVPALYRVLAGWQGISVSPALMLGAVRASTEP